MSRDTKKELLLYQPVGDTAAMARHLEKRAEQGWLLEAADNWWLRYRRAEPTGVRYAVAFFPDATVCDAAPVEGQETYYDYCRAAGWEYVCSYGSAQYFRNFRPDPVPIETDERLKLKALRRVMLRTMLLSAAIFLLLAFMMLDSVRSGFRWNPLSSLSGYAFPAMAVMSLAFLLVGLLSLAHVGFWFLLSHWSVKRGGPCARISAWAQIARDCLLLAVALPALVLMCLEQTGSWRFIVVELAGDFLLAVGARALLRQLKRRGLSNTAVLICTIAGIAAGSVIFNFGLLKAERAIGDSVPKDWPQAVRAEELPLTLEELGYAVTEADQCEYFHEKSGRTPWAAFDSWYQGATASDSELPAFSCEIADIPWDWLRKLCWDTLMKGPKYRSHWLGGCTPIDPAPWGADAAARRNRTQVLLYGERIVLVTTGWTPTEGEAAVIGAALGGR